MTASSVAPIPQALERPGVIELFIGQPELSLLPAEAMAEAAASALRTYGPDALAYGIEQGPPPLLEWIRGHLARVDGRAPAEAELMVTAGNSQGLDHVVTLFARSGDVALVEVPTYHLALGILRDHGMELVGVETDVDGLIPDALEAAVQRSRAAGKRVSLLYTVPTFGNPTGRTIPEARRRRIIELATEYDFLVAEDDVYRELWYEREPPRSIGSLAGDGPVIRLGSFSKSLAPGLRLGWLSSSAERVERMVLSGIMDSGGGLNPMVGLTVERFAASGAYEPNVASLRATYRARRDALIGGLREALPDAEVESPAGGYFVWLRLPGGLDAAELLPAAVAGGVSFIPGIRFDATGVEGHGWIRISFARYQPDTLAEGAQRLGAVVRGALAR